MISYSFSRIPCVCFVFGVVLLVSLDGVDGIRGLVLPWRAPFTHPEWTARERWIDYLSANPLGKLYNLYR